MVRASQRDGAGPSKDILNSDDSVASARPYGEAVQSNVLYVTLPLGPAGAGFPNPVTHFRHRRPSAETHANMTPLVFLLRIDDARNMRRLYRPPVPRARKNKFGISRHKRPLCQRYSDLQERWYGRPGEEGEYAASLLQSPGGDEGKIAHVPVAESVLDFENNSSKLLGFSGVSYFDKITFPAPGPNRRLSGSLRGHAPFLLTRIARVNSLVSQLIRDLEGELKLAVRQVTVCLDDG